MKNKKGFHLTFTALCFVFAVACAVIYGVSNNENIRILSAVGFAVCSAVFIKMFLEFLKEIRFGRKIFG